MIEHITKQEFLKLSKKKNKYNAKKTDYTNIVFDSKWEAKKAYDLDMLAYASEIKGYKRQVRIPLDVNGIHICDYIADFEITHLNGTIEYIERKGYETDVWKLKHKLFRAIYPERLLTVEK